MENGGAGRWGRGQTKVAEEEGNRRGAQRLAQAGRRIYEHSALHV